MYSLSFLYHLTLEFHGFVYSNCSCFSFCFFVCFFFVNMHACDWLKRLSCCAHLILNIISEEFVIHLFTLEGLACDYISTVVLAITFNYSDCKCQACQIHVHVLHTTKTIIVFFLPHDGHFPTSIIYIYPKKKPSLSLSSIRLWFVIALASFPWRLLPTWNSWRWGWDVLFPWPFTITLIYMPPAYQAHSWHNLT